MNDDAFFLTIWKLIAAVIITIVLSMSGCVMHTNTQISRAIENGADPMKASCAFNNDGKLFCTIIATKS